MRIIAGKAKGLQLTAPKGLDIRPTLDRVREALFSIIGPRIEGAAFLDLFAGTGANGIEALSRGARFCAFVEKDRRAVAAIKRNLEAAHSTDQAQIYGFPLPDGLHALKPPEGGYNLIFADPPYAFEQHQGLLTHIADQALIAKEGMVIIEHPARAIIQGEKSGFEERRTTKYGDTALSFFS